MPRPKLQKTLADYLAIAVTPLLIMVLVGSLVFFLQELFDTGSARFAGRIRVIMVSVVVGMVLIARIAIESGRGQASLFTMALAGVTALAIFKFVPDNPWVPIACLGLIWWCADKLTWDCTLIDDSEDASGEGLLQVAGVADEAELAADSESPDADETAKTAGSEADGSGEHVPLWKRLFRNTAEREGKPHAPGLWVVYFSLAALPIFGFGQAAISSADTESRQFSFYCLLLYVASGLGLLLLTSFLGLRRYLRQRNLQMPTTMAATWIGVGAVIAAGILALCLLLPRPQGEYDITAMIDSAGDSLQEASDRAFLNDGGGEGEGQRTGEADPDAEQGAASDPNQQGQSGGRQPGQQAAQNSNDQGQDQEGGERNGQGGGSDREGNQQQGSQQQADRQRQQGAQQNSGQQTAQNDRAQGRQQGDNAQNDQGQQSGRDGQPPDGQQTAQNEQQQNEANRQDGDRQNQGEQQNENDPQGENRQVAQNEEQNEQNDNTEASSPDGSMPEPETPDLSSAMSMIGTLFKWIVYAILAAIVLYLAWRNRQAVMNFLQNLWHEFLSLFGRRPVAEEAAEEGEAEPVVPRVAFSSFRNPFATGVSRNHSPEELVRYSFEALQAWAFERGVGRTPDQTPIEFGQQLRLQRVPCGAEANELGQLYAQVAYAGHRPGTDALPLLENLWRKLS